jgi:hypothetical protein
MIHLVLLYLGNIGYVDPLLHLIVLVHALVKVGHKKNSIRILQNCTKGVFVVQISLEISLVQ